MRYVVALLALGALAACDDAAVKTFSGATADVNEGFALGRSLRDRCAATGDVDHCLDWQNYKKAAEADNALLDYDKALARWERFGPY
jgi:hypothetical protein